MRLIILLAVGWSRGPELVLVTGVVKVDGQLADGVQVSFWPPETTGKESRNRYGAAMTGSDGRFQLGSISEKGIEPGDYVVTFSRLVAGGKVVRDPKKKGVHESLQERYTKQETTDITARVSKDSRDFVFELSLKPK